MSGSYQHGEKNLGLNKQFIKKTLLEKVVLRWKICSALPFCKTVFLKAKNI
jgi:hypothetical protein